MITAERLSWLVGLIYDSAIDSTRRPLAMEAIRVELNFANSTLNLQPFPLGEVLVNVTSNIPQQYIDLMADAGPDVVEQWGGAQFMRAFPLSEPAVLTRVNPTFDTEATTNR